MIGARREKRISAALSLHCWVVSEPIHTRNEWEPPGNFHPRLSTNGDSMLTPMSYREQLLHPNWQRRRLEIFERDRYTCQHCGDTETTLHVQHKRYIKGRKVWEYEGDLLETLCADCHKQDHADRELLDRLLAQPEMSMATAIGLIAGYLEGGCDLDAELYEAALQIDGHSCDLGMFASIVSGASWPAMASSAALLGHCFTPPQKRAIARWRGDEEPAH